ncbi:hypothetical protein MNBD_BACTEROID06-480, partial [hydrothermal vent metagenome]
NRITTENATIAEIITVPIDQFLTVISGTNIFINCEMREERCEI